MQVGFDRMCQLWNEKSVKLKWKEMISTNFTYQRRECVPCPEGDHESEPREEEHTSVDVDNIEHRHSPGLPVDRVDLRRLHEVRECEGETHFG